MLILRRSEEAVIDAARTRVEFTSPHVVQGNTPGENLMNVGEDRPAPLPDPSVGGRNASGRQNGWSDGIWPRSARWGRFTGAMAKLPAVRNAVQGRVGTKQGAQRPATLYAGVMDQSVQYRPDQIAVAREAVGAS